MTLKFTLERFCKRKGLYCGVVAIIEKDGKYLLVDRANRPYGHSFITGHVHYGESLRKAAIREVREEVGLRVVDCDFLRKEEVHRECIENCERHLCYFYKCKVGGEIKIDSREVKSARWYSKEAVNKLKLEPLTKEWFDELK